MDILPALAQPLWFATPPTEDGRDILRLKQVKVTGALLPSLLAGAFRFPTAFPKPTAEIHEYLESSDVPGDLIVLAYLGVGPDNLWHRFLVWSSTFEPLDSSISPLPDAVFEYRRKVKYRADTYEVVNDHDELIAGYPTLALARAAAEQNARAIPGAKYSIRCTVETYQMLPTNTGPDVPADAKRWLDHREFIPG